MTGLGAQASGVRDRGTSALLVFDKDLHFCIHCGGDIAAVLMRLGSLRCHGCREGAGRGLEHAVPGDRENFHAAIDEGGQQ